MIICNAKNRSLLWILNRSALFRERSAILHISSHHPRTVAFCFHSQTATAARTRDVVLMLLLTPFLATRYGCTPTK